MNAIVPKQSAVLPKLCAQTMKGRIHARVQWVTREMANNVQVSVYSYLSWSLSI